MYTQANVNTELTWFLKERFGLDLCITMLCAVS